MKKSYKNYGWRPIWHIITSLKFLSNIMRGLEKFQNPVTKMAVKFFANFYIQYFFQEWKLSSKLIYPENAVFSFSEQGQIVIDLFQKLLLNYHQMAVLPFSRCCANATLN